MLTIFHEHDPGSAAKRIVESVRMERLPGPGDPTVLDSTQAVYQFHLYAYQGKKICQARLLSQFLLLIMKKKNKKSGTARGAARSFKLASNGYRPIFTQTQL